ncbi:hypothetical protein HZH66_006230 [Vespula vulgaris]|uniref:Uncharacterized protein n=1 Tax=Vespula vulgaris TaxID=7454 RepID=A0A834K6L5_VESVU|nr:hypothetical protein HZH66_006230 [Vespula vulgaris]
MATPTPTATAMATATATATTSVATTTKYTREEARHDRPLYHCVYLCALITSNMARDRERSWFGGRERYSFLYWVFPKYLMCLKQR